MADVPVSYLWRGPFKVVRNGRKWWIVNADGDVERLGYVTRSAANEACQLMNRAQTFCDPIEDSGKGE